MKRLKVDFDLCESNALCTGFAPDVFEIDDDDYLQVHTYDVTPENEPRIRQAVSACPKSALSIEE
ncbi:ferredoxin [Nocardioides caldifontis]|uniref:ferredoxin n=1 Tax=Nocardioides caldifontis TaxID=2588938 RepID=UPI0011DF0144|nr:ferredoxin [Nocardioides caldifontis]